MTTVLDASALLAHLLDEAGGDLVGAALHRGARMSSVNWSEVLAKTSDLGSDPRALTDDLRARGLFSTLEIVAFDAADAVLSAELRAPTRQADLSFGDRACLSLGIRLGLPVMTADRTWRAVRTDAEVVAIR
ncbi:MAG: type II toxin-antitoxin system VapC family toxin [Actinomycetota bacterium]